MSDHSALSRNYGIDLLRIISMHMVLILHILGLGGVLNAVPSLSSSYETAWFLEIASYCAVNCYGLISGYVGIHSTRTYTNLILLWLQVAFYHILIYAVYYIVCPGSFSLEYLQNILFPVMTRQYWFFTAYFGMSLFLPLLNPAIAGLTKKQAGTLTFSLILIFTSAQTVFRTDSFGTNMGYGVLWLLILYIIGGCIGTHDFFSKIRKLSLLAIYIFCVVCTWLVKFYTDQRLARLSMENPGTLFLIDYTSATILTAALALLIFFSKIRVNPLLIRLLRLFTPCTFSVYIIHTHPVVKQFLFTNLFSAFGKLSSVHLLLTVIGISLLIFFACAGFDLLRVYIFKKLKIRQKADRIMSRLL